MSNELLKEALHYMELGFSVIPIIPGQKKPLISWLPFQKVHADKTQIISWWSLNPNANIGIVTGEVSDLFVVDIDTEEGQRNLLEYGFDSVTTPTVKTPRGGQHLYFRYPKGTNLTIGAGLILGTDFRGNNGYVLAPPSINGTGKAYEWLIDLTCDLSNALPSAYLKKISSFRGGVIGGGTNLCNDDVMKPLQNITNLTEPYIWDIGTRDDNLYHIALSLSKTNNSIDYIRQVLRAIVWSWGERDEKWIQAKIDSALNLLDRKQRNVMQEIRDWVSLHSGYFFITESLHSLQLITKEEKNTGTVAFKRLYDEGYLERHGDKRGCYRKKETDIQKTKFIKEKIIDFPVILPLDLNTHLKIYPKSVIMIAGSKSAGKTAMALTIAMKNQDFTPVRYMHSEGGDEEFSERMQNFGITDESEIHFEAIPRAKDFHDLVTAEKKIFIIDYLEVHKDFYEIGIPIKQIHDNLKDGIAIICLQKKHGELYGRGNEFSQEVARLYLSMEYSEKEQLTKVIIVDAKAPKGEESMRGWFRSVKITRHGTRLTPTDTQWNKPYGN